MNSSNPSNLFYGSISKPILVLSELPEVSDAVSGRPFTGQWGRLIKGLCNSAWASYGLTSNDIMMGYVVSHRPKGMKTGRLKDLYAKPKSSQGPSQELIDSVKSLKERIEACKPRVVIALGESVFRILTGYDSFETMRGYITLVEGFVSYPLKVIGTYHPERLLNPQEYYLRYITVLDLKKAIPEASQSEPTWTRHEVISNASIDEFTSYCHWLSEGTPDDSFPYREDALTGVAIDIENIHGYGNHLTQIGIGHSDKFAVTLNIWNHLEYLQNNPLEELRVYEALDRLSKSREDFIFHNGIHDISLLFKNMGILFTNSFDTMLAGQLLWPEFRKSLAFLSSFCLNVPPWKHLSGEETYNAEDVLNTKALKTTLKDLLEKKGLTKIFDLEMREVPMAAMLQLQGIKVDPVKKEKLLEEYKEEKENILKQLREEIKKEAPNWKGIDTLNLNSAPQKKELLYEVLKFPIQYQRRKSTSEPLKETTDQEALIKLKRKVKSPIPDLIMRYNKTAKAVSSYLSFELSPWNTVHTSYNIGSSVERFKSKDKADSFSLGRWSSSSSIIFPYGPGNLQAIPKYARKMFVPFEDQWEIGCGDYVQAEAVVVAYLSDDKPLIELIEKGNELRKLYRASNSPQEREEIKEALIYTDMHRAKINEVMRIPFKEITDEQRQIGKVLRHATNYRSGPGVTQALGAGAGIHESMTYWKNLMKVDEQVSPYKYLWHKSIDIELASQGYLDNPFGRRRYFTAANSSYEALEKVKRSGYAFKPQSTIGDLLNTGMLDFYNKYCERVRLLLQLHDGTYPSYPLEERELWLSRLRECMEIEIEINHHKVIIDIEFQAGPSWGDLKDVVI